MYQKILLFLLLSILSFYTDYQILTERISGQVKTKDGKPEIGVTVIIQGLNRITTNNESGNYVFNNIKPGSYPIRISCVGCLSKEILIRAEAGKIVIANFRLSENPSHLSAVNLNQQQTLSKLYR